MALRRQWLIPAALLVLAAVSGASRPCQAAPPAFHSFKVTVYIPVQAVERMAHDPAWMRSSWHTISSRLHVDQVFIEDYRSGVSADDATIAQVKQFFVSQGVAVAGGMAMLGAVRSPQFQTLDYTVPADRALASRMSALLARHFDTFVLDDLYFFNTKSDSDIAAKGKAELGAVSHAHHGRGLARPHPQASQGREPQRQGHHQVPELLSLLPGDGLRPEERAEDLSGNLDGR